MSDSALLQQFIGAFLREMEEHIRAMTRDLLALEREEPGARRAALVDTLLRSAHSLKGAAGVMGQPIIVAGCHEMESLLTSAEHSESPAPIEQLLAIVDALKDAGARLHAGSSGDEPPAIIEAPPEKIASSPWPRAEVHRTPRPTAGSSQPPRSAKASPRNGPARDPILADPRRSVHVSAEKLDALLSRSEEILIARRGAHKRDADVAAIQDFVRAWEKEWRVVEKELAGLLRERAEETREGEAPPRRPGGVTLLSPRAARGIEATRDNFRRLQRDLTRVAALLDEDRRRLDSVAVPLDEQVRRIRMLPFAEACEGLDRAVRDLGKSSGKDVELHIAGSDVELDRAVLDELRDPLLHLVRNAVSHGIEAPADRAAVGKVPRARVAVSARLRGAQVEIVVSDDGRGLDAGAIREKAREMGLAEPEDARALARLILLPRFSTARTVTEVSGRGIGLDVVRTVIERLRGSVEPSFIPGEGARFALTVPLTLSTVRVLLVSCAGRMFAFDCNHVDRVVRVDAGDLPRIDGRPTLAIMGAARPVARLADLLGLRSPEPRPADERTPGVVVAMGGERMVVLVDELLDEREAIVKGLGARVRSARFVSGATILPSGRIALILLTSSLFGHAQNGGEARAQGGAPGRSDARARPSVLVVDDAFTIRAVQKSILETAGFEVTLAPDGAEAWALLQKHTFDVVVTDVEMPNMDGFALLSAIRGSSRAPRMPVVLVTSRGSEADRVRGIQAGANAYLVKSAFDEELMLTTIRRLL